MLLELWQPGAVAIPWEACSVLHHLLQIELFPDIQPKAPSVAQMGSCWHLQALSTPALTQVTAHPGATVLPMGLSWYPSAEMGSSSRKS